MTDKTFIRCSKCRKPLKGFIVWDHDVSSMAEYGPVRSFASYSRRDAALVEPIVSLMRTAGGHVFYDKTDIAPGDKWSTVISNRLREAQVLFVFWSKFAARSDYVKGEVESALGYNKTIVPVLLDDTALWEETAPFQWVDFRGRIPEYPAREPAPTALPTGPSSSLIALVCFTILAPLIFFILYSSFMPTALKWNGDQHDLASILLPAGMFAVALVLLWLIWKMVRPVVQKVSFKFEMSAPLGYELCAKLAEELDVRARESVCL